MGLYCLLDWQLRTNTGAKWLLLLLLLLLPFLLLLVPICYTCINRQLKMFESIQLDDTEYIDLF
jgi:hypothetical protein